MPAIFFSCAYGLKKYSFIFHMILILSVNTSLLDLIQNAVSLVIIKVGYVAASFQDLSRYL